MREIGQEKENEPRNRDRKVGESGVYGFGLFLSEITIGDHGKKRKEKKQLSLKGPSQVIWIAGRCQESRVSP